jgi:histidine triad (HIT) family protein
MASNSCLFCRIVDGEIPARVVLETEHAIAFHDIQPQAPVHVLVIPKRHLSSLAEARVEDGELLSHLALVAAEVARATGIAESGFRTVVNSGADAQQSVHHLHLHVLGGRTMTWPPG